MTMLCAVCCPTGNSNEDKEKAAIARLIEVWAATANSSAVPGREIARRNRLFVHLPRLRPERPESRPWIGGLKDPFVGGSGHWLALFEDRSVGQCWRTAFEVATAMSCRTGPSAVHLHPCHWRLAPTVPKCGHDPEKGLGGWRGIGVHTPQRYQSDCLDRQVESAEWASGFVAALQARDWEERPQWALLPTSPLKLDTDADPPAERG